VKDFQIGLGGRDLGLVYLGHHLGSYKGGEQTDNNQNGHKLYHRKTFSDCFYFVFIHPSFTSWT
jgi:hypothetical protein